MDATLANLISTLVNNEMNMDSITIGTPSKGGEMKVYFNANNPEDAKLRIDRAVLALEYARQKHAGELQ